MNPYTTLLPGKLPSAYRIYLLAFLVACLCFPRYNLWYTWGIDGALPWVFNYFADGHPQLGKNTLFPHGPLAFFLYPLPVGNNLIICSAVFLFCSSALFVSLFRVSIIKQQENYFLHTVLMLLLLPLLDIQLLLIALTLTQTILFHLTYKKWHLALALFFTVFNLFIKTYGGMICGSIIAGELAHVLFFRKDRRLALSMVAGFFLFFYFFWLLLYKSFSGSVNFMVGQIALSSDNSEAVAFYSPNNWMWTGIAIVSLLAIPFFTRDRLTKYICLIMLLPFFAAWKHAMARVDEQHMNGFVYFQLMFLGVLFSTGQEKRISVIVLCLVSVSAFSLNLAHHGYLDQKRIAVIRPFNLYELLTKYSTLKEECQATSMKNIERHKLPAAMMELIGKETVDVFPWNYAIIPLNQLNWVPRPVIHSYATYTNWLDERNAEHLRSAKAARFLVWEMADINENGHTIESIDFKYLLNDGPKSMAALLSCYELKFKDDDFLLFEQRAKPLTLKQELLSAPAPVTFNTWIDVPGPLAGCATRARIEIKKSLSGRLKSFFYKGEAFFILYETEDKKVYVHSIVPKNAAEGLWIDPLVLNAESNFKEPRVKRIKVICPEPGMVQPEFSLAFERLRFNELAQRNTDLQEHFFYKNQLPRKLKLFSASCNAETPAGESWTESRDAKKTQGFYELKPGGYSGHFRAQINNDSLPKNLRYLQFYATAKVRAGKNSNALLVISQAGENGLSFWWYKRIRELVTDEEGWNSVYYSRKVKPTDVRFDEPFSFYIWNADTAGTVTLDDFSVSIEGMAD